MSLSVETTICAGDTVRLFPPIISYREHLPSTRRVRQGGCEVAGNKYHIYSLGIPSKKKNYVDRETVPKVGRGVAPFPYKDHS